MEKKISVNKFPQEEYDFEYEVEAGIQLKSSEVKSIRKSKPSIRDSYCIVNKEEIFIKNLTLAHAIDKSRDKKLLLHKKQIKKINGLFSKKSMLIIIKELYEKNGLIKALICVGKKTSEIDKRAKIIKKDILLRSKMERIFT